MSKPSGRLSQISHLSLAEQAREQIRTAIFEGKIKPDERISIERIATELGVSRTPVREAVKSLENDGILRITPGKALVVQRFGPEDLVERYAVRALLEGYAGEIACAKQDANLIAELEANLQSMTAKAGQLVPGADDLEISGELIALNHEFHRAIVQASGCVLVGKVLDSLQMPFAYRLYQYRMPGRPAVVLEYHRKIIEAFRSRNPTEVRTILESHVRETSDFLLSTQLKTE